MLLYFCFHDTTTTVIYTYGHPLSLHDALPIYLSRSPLRRGVNEPTFVLGAFNPGLARLPSGNLLLMVRVAEALQNAVSGTDVHAIRWTPEGYVLDPHPLDSVEFNDPRPFALKRGHYALLALTSLSCVLPVEIFADCCTVSEVNYETAIQPP